MRILSYNIQAAIASDSYFSYLSRLHLQIMPSPTKTTVYGVVIVLSWVGLDFRHAKSQTNQHTRPHHAPKSKCKISRKND